MRTEIFINVDLKPETPVDVIDTLRAMCACDSEAVSLLGRPPRWGSLFRSNSYYHLPQTQCGNLTYDEVMAHWALLGKGEISNPDGAIEAFFEWVMPWVDAAEGMFIGYLRREEDYMPKLVLKSVEKDSVGSDVFGEC